MSASVSVNDLISRAFATIGIYPPYKIISGQEILDALNYFNELLDYFAHNELYIPFFKEITFTVIVGQDEYVISQDGAADVTANPIIELNYVNLLLNNVSYPVAITAYDQVISKVRNTEDQSRPDRVILQRGVETSKIIFYQKPDFAYDCVIRAKTFFTNVVLLDDLTELPKYYHRFLRLTLGRELGSIYKTGWTPDLEARYQEMLKEIKGAADFPLSTDVNPVFSSVGIVSDSRIGVLS